MRRNWRGTAAAVAAVVLAAACGTRPSGGPQPVALVGSNSQGSRSSAESSRDSRSSPQSSGGSGISGVFPRNPAGGWSGGPLAAQPAAPRPATGPDSVDPRDTVPFLASDALGGRGVGTAGLDTAALFISGEFRSIGLEPLPSLGGYYQPLMMTTATALGPNTTLDLGDGKSYVAREDFIPASFSRPGAFSGPVVFVGYGVSAGKEYVYDDYDGVDVGGKVALAMRFEPHDASGKSRFKPDTWSEMATLGRKALTAAQHGAAALVLVTPWEYHGFDSLMTFNTHLMEGRATIPVIQVTRPVAEALLKRGEVKDLKSLQELIDTTGQPHSAELNNVSVSGNIDMKPTVMPVKNIVGVLPGVGPHADEYVVVGAHYDHLGTGRYGGTLGPRGAIYHGADDNASGTAAVLELASKMAAGGPRARSILFVTFTGEEEGLIGSEYFVEHPPVPLNKIVGMINMDMVGRLKNENLSIGGTGTAAGFDAMIAGAIAGSPMHLTNIGAGGLGPSDHMSFALKHVPVLFLFTGLHADYHRPTDTADKINYDGIDQVVEFADRLAEAMTTMPRQEYVLAADRFSMTIGTGSSGGEGAERKAYLGVIPDFDSSDSTVGVIIQGTMPDSPAAAAGLQGGDLLVQFNQIKLTNLMDLNQALVTARPGDAVTLKVLRGKESLELHTTLGKH
jgi:hypothetical protein